MCYAIPGKVVEVRGKLVTLDYFGEKREAVNEFTYVKPGDYVYAQGGFVVQEISETEAVAILDSWKQKFFQLKEIDNKLSQDPGSSELFKDVIDKINDNVTLEKNDLLRIMNYDGLFKLANSIRAKHLKNSCCVHGIIEFSNHCNNNCTYCGIRCSNSINRYRMNPEEIIEHAKKVVNELGFKALVLQSGDDDWYTTDKLVNIIKEVKKLGVLIFMSIGNRDKDCYTEMYKAGARGVLLRFETSNFEIYEKVHPNSKLDLEKRVELIKHCRELGYIIATGSIIGLPGQTDEDIINDILLTKKLGAEMYSFGPLIPHKDTPLADHEKISLEKMLKVIAIARLVDPDGKILVTTALENLDKQGKRKGLLAGANSLMINVTPTNYKQDYNIYPRIDNEVKQDIADTLQVLYSIGRAPTDLGI